mgnify:CR=1 FL=1
MSNKLKKDELVDLSFAVLDFARAAENLDHLLIDATEAGIEAGKILGLFEAYEHLHKLGYTRSAKAIKVYIDEVYPQPPQAKA